MPTYTFEDENEEVHLIEMKMDELDDFKKNNPHLTQILVNPTTTIDPITAGITRPPADFQKFVLDKVKAKTPKNNMNYSRWHSGVNEI